AAGAEVVARLPDVLVLAGERPLGAVLAKHVVLDRRQLRAPLGVGLLDLLGLRRHRTVSGIRQLAIPCLTRYRWWYSSAGQNSPAAVISVAIGRLNIAWARALEASAASCCCGVV